MKNDIHQLRITVQDMHRLLEKLVALQEADHRLCRVVLQPGADTSADELEDYLDKQQVKDYLGIGEATYYRWVREGKLNPRGGKGQHRYYKRDIRELMEARKYRYRG
ncbi:helix-turn-helix domain-containing protein [Parapedobacter koreensis]|uniref:Helix-turn-helix domain-containing protein n=1 Tax=Parapedobacter koreensis TaxID=332977 RepID=A0A1H7UAV0_9SPHI|nr:helix-turn-helix domain-containing protein [Parapedobacter koreensis]SEL93427.1 Helix-turn-helix domain-containing protein [Parapedobacter koreensis]